MSEKEYDSAYIKKVVGWLEEKHQKMEDELKECRKKNSK